MKPGRQGRRRRRSGDLDRASVRSDARNQRPVPDLRVRVDRVVIEGLSRSEGVSLGRAVERELVERLRTTVAAGDGPRIFDRLDAGEVCVSPYDRIATVAARLASTIGERIEE